MTTMVMFQTFHVFNSRSFRRSFFTLNPFSNKLVFVSVISALALHVLALYFTPLQFVLRTEPLALETWGVIIAAAVSVLVVIEIEKLIRRSTGRA